MAEEELLVEDDKALVAVNERRDGLGAGPRRRLVVPVGELIEVLLVKGLCVVRILALNAPAKTLFVRGGEEGE
jgi:hypothetical protein